MTIYRMLNPRLLAALMHAEKWVDLKDDPIDEAALWAQFELNSSKSPTDKPETK